MSDERIDALEQEVARLRRKLESPELTVNLGYIVDEHGGRATATVANTGVLPAQVTSVAVTGPGEVGELKGKVSYNFKAVDEQPWPLMAGESRRYEFPPTLAPKLRAAMTFDWKVVVKCGEVVVAESPAHELLGFPT